MILIFIYYIYIYLNMWYLYVYIYIYMCVTCVPLRPVRNHSVISSEILVKFHFEIDSGMKEPPQCTPCLASWFHDRAWRILNISWALSGATHSPVFYLTSFPDITRAYRRTAPVYNSQMHLYRCDFEKDTGGRFQMIDHLNATTTGHVEWLCLCRGCSRHLTAWSW